MTAAVDSHMSINETRGSLLGVVVLLHDSYESSVRWRMLPWKEDAKVDVHKVVQGHSMAISLTDFFGDFILTE